MSEKDDGAETVQSQVQVNPEFQELFLDYANTARDLAGSGAGQSFAPFATYVPQSNQTQAGLGMLEANAAGGSPLAGDAYGALGGMINSNPSQSPFGPQGPQDLTSTRFLDIQAQGQPSRYETPLMASGQARTTAGLPQIQNFAGGQSNPYSSAIVQQSSAPTTQGMDTLGQASAGQLQNTQADVLNPAVGGLSTGVGTLGQAATGGFSNAEAGALDPAANALQGGVDALQGTASGNFVGANPYLDDQFNRAADQIEGQVKGLAASRGMSGSGLEQDMFADTLAGLATDMYGGAYNMERGFQESAGSQLAGLGLSGAATAAGLGESALDRQIGAGSNLAGLGLSGATTTAGLGENALSRQVGAAGQLAGIDQTDRATGLSGLSTAAGLAESDYGRSLDAAGQLAAINTNDLNRETSAIMGAAGLENQQFNQSLAAQQFNQGLVQQNNQNDFTNAQINNQFSNDATSRQLGAIGALPGMFDYQNQAAQQMLGVGATQEGYAGQELQDAINRFNFEQSAPWDQLFRYGQALGLSTPGMGQTQTQMIPTQNSWLQGAIGGGMLGYQVGGPWGAAGGAALGAFA